MVIESLLRERDAAPEMYNLFRLHTVHKLQLGISMLLKNFWFHIDFQRYLEKWDVLRKKMGTQWYLENSCALSVYRTSFWKSVKLYYFWSDDHQLEGRFVM